jgi:hypothetical protein
MGCLCRTFCEEPLARHVFPRRSPHSNNSSCGTRLRVPETPPVASHAVRGSRFGEMRCRFPFVGNPTDGPRVR